MFLIGLILVVVAVVTGQWWVLIPAVVCLVIGLGIAAGEPWGGRG